MLSLKTRATALMCLLSLALAPTLAHAQSNAGEGATIAGVYSGTSSTYLTVIGLPVTTTVGIVLVVVSLSKDGSAELEHYLNHNKEEVQASLYTRDAAQQGTQDLAFLFGVSEEHRAEFAAMLVQEREALAPLLLEDEVSSEQAYSFAVHIVDAMNAHPVLSEDVERTLAAYHEAQAAN